MGENYFGSAAAHIQRLGTAIVTLSKKFPPPPSCDCYVYVYDLVSRAARQVGDPDLPAWNKHKPFCMLWGSHNYLSQWPKLPDELRGRGAPGAMLGDGRGTAIYEADAIWSGMLEPGAVVQVWTTFSMYLRVVNGEPPGGIGHSFAFKNYVFDGDTIVGMKVIDNGHHGTDTITRSKWGYWAATNVRCLGAGGSPKTPDSLKEWPMPADPGEGDHVWPG